MQRGFFITLEGGEGAGKTTLLANLQARLRSQGHEVVLTREPGGTPGAEAIRALLVTGSADRWTALSELCLFFAAREDHLDRLIRPALARGAIVLCDRFSDSTRAYQGQAGGAGRAAVDMLDQLIVGTTQPDLTLILDIDPAIGLKRAAARRGHEDRFEGKAFAFHTALRAAYLEIAATYPARCAVLDAATAPQELADVAWSTLNARLNLA
ncbi:thymidylate kinase [Candidatus Phycosocius bacilliformis]|uniref:Thymidylate kinase n=1 Tax=Candidatus Phycosocius bacilliformis TaxID=1445552 RepID=A0A2P2E7Y8_9PROT|nr:dTMP kinase [Candidatus Phycosocius bacilliformis]GBF57178.1 thymidylate kinase [Candidatus Phycosocius bacilliformis]